MMPNVLQGSFDPARPTSTLALPCFHVLFTDLRLCDIAHINNLYNTTFWALVLQGGLTTRDADKRLKVSGISSTLALRFLFTPLSMSSHFTKLTNGPKPCVSPNYMLINPPMRRGPFPRTRMKYCLPSSASTTTLYRLCFARAASSSARSQTRALQIPKARLTNLPAQVSSEQTSSCDRLRC